MDLLRAEIHIFVYGTLIAGDGARHLLGGCTRIGPATVHGTLYDLGDYPALILGGTGLVHGEVWRCPAARLERLDDYESVAGGLFRRIGLETGEHACWVYVAGPALAAELTPDRRVASGRWRARAGTAGRDE